MFFSCFPGPSAVSVAGGPRGGLHAGPDPAPLLPHLDQRADEAAEADAHHLREVPNGARSWA